MCANAPLRSELSFLHDQRILVLLCVV